MTSFVFLITVFELRPSLLLSIIEFPEVVYSTNSIQDLECFLDDNGWDGNHMETGEKLPLGMYVYEIYYQDFEGWKHQDFGEIYIIR